MTSTSHVKSGAEIVRGQLKCSNRLSFGELWHNVSIRCFWISIGIPFTANSLELLAEP
jgi:hypothetical protein